MHVNPQHYIYPPRAKDAIPFTEAKFLNDMQWIAQLKYNDSRILIKYHNNEIEIWNRHANKLKTYNLTEELTEQLKEVHHKLNLSKDHWTLLDGGLLHQKHSAIKNTIVIWDILVKDSQHQLTTTYSHRYDFLSGNLNTNEPYLYTHPTHSPIDIGIKITDNIILPRNYTNGWENLWEETINTINAPHTTGKPGDKNYDLKPVIEGLVFKSPTGKLERGTKEANNSSWMCRSRVVTGRHQF